MRRLNCDSLTRLHHAAAEATVHLSILKVKVRRSRRFGVTRMTPKEAEAARQYARAIFRRMLIGWVQDTAALRQAQLDRPCRRKDSPALYLRRAA